MQFSCGSRPSVQLLQHALEGQDDLQLEGHHDATSPPQQSGTRASGNSSDKGGRGIKWHATLTLSDAKEAFQAVSQFWKRIEASSISWFSRPPLTISELLLFGQLSLWSSHLLCRALTAWTARSKQDWRHAAGQVEGASFHHHQVRALEGSRARNFFFPDGCMALCLHSPGGRPSVSTN